MEEEKYKTNWALNLWCHRVQHPKHLEEDNSHIPYKRVQCHTITNHLQSHEVSIFYHFSSIIIYFGPTQEKSKDS